MKIRIRSTVLLFSFLLTTSCGIEKMYEFDSEDNQASLSDNTVDLKISSYVRDIEGDHSDLKGSVFVTIKNVSSSPLQIHKIKSAFTYAYEGTNYPASLTSFTTQDQESEDYKVITLDPTKPLKSLSANQKDNYEFTFVFGHPIPKEVKYLLRIDTVEYSTNDKRERFIKTIGLKRKTVLLPWVFSRD